jgi:hypothetical protein
LNFDLFRSLQKKFDLSVIDYGSSLWMWRSKREALSPPKPVYPAIRNDKTPRMEFIERE